MDKEVKFDKDTFIVLVCPQCKHKNKYKVKKGRFVNTKCFNCQLKESK